MGKAGRPTKYSEELADDICNRIAGGESLNSICKEGEYPTMSCVLMWVVNGKHPLFFDKYRKAREAQGLYDGDRLRDIVETMVVGEIEPQVAKVAIDAYKWTAARNAARVYGKRVEEQDTAQQDTEVESDKFEEQLTAAAKGAWD